MSGSKTSPQKGASPRAIPHSVPVRAARAKAGRTSEIVTPVARTSHPRRRPSASVTPRSTGEGSTARPTAGRATRPPRRARRGPPRASWAPPVPVEAPLAQRKEPVDGHAGRGHEQDGGEHRGGLEVVVVVGNEVPEPRRRQNELRGEHTDEGVDEAEPEADEQVGYGRRDDDVDDHLGAGQAERGSDG